MRIRGKGIVPWKLKLVIPLLISLVPSNLLRILLYRIACGYQIPFSARVGFGTLLAVDKVKMGRAFVGWFNVFQGPFTLVVEDDVHVAMFNTFRCGQWVLEENERDDPSLLRLVKLKRNCEMLFFHFVDATGGFELGEDTTVAGRHSQFWTHGTGVRDKSITIGNDCYIGSAVRFAPGASVGNHCVVGLGSVVTSKFNGDHLQIAGVPARVLQENWDWRRHGPFSQSHSRARVESGEVGMPSGNHSDS